MPESPIVARRCLGMSLRAARLAAKVKPDVAERAIQVGASMLSKIEYGRRGIKARHVTALSQLYQLDQETTDELMTLAIKAEAPAWWTAYRVREHYTYYVGMETAADLVQTYEQIFVPGLLQTEDYARTLEQADGPDQISPVEVERATGLRRARQARLSTTDHPLAVDAVVAEPALRWLVGGPKVMSDQLEHLIRLSKQDNITIRVLPYTAGAHQSMRGPYSLLRFHDTPELDLVYLEQHWRGDYLERPEQIEGFAAAHTELHHRAMGVVESRRWMRNLANDLACGTSETSGNPQKESE